MPKVARRKYVHSHIGAPSRLSSHLTKRYSVRHCDKYRRTAAFPLTNRDLVELITHYRQQGPHYNKEYRYVRGSRLPPSRLQRKSLCGFAGELQKYSREFDPRGHRFRVLGPAGIQCHGETQLCGNSCIPLYSRKGKSVHCSGVARPKRRRAHKPAKITYSGGKLRIPRSRLPLAAPPSLAKFMSM